MTNIHSRMDALNLNPICYTSLTTQNNQAIPRDVLGADGKTCIIYRHKDGNYDFPGWEPYHDRMFGGRYDRFESALAWIERAYDIRVDHF